MYFLVFKRSQTCPSAHLASCGSVQEVNQPGYVVNHPHPPPSNAKIKGEQSYRMHPLILCEYTACYWATFTFPIYKIKLKNIPHHNHYVYKTVKQRELRTATCVSATEHSYCVKIFINLRSSLT